MKEFWDTSWSLSKKLYRFYLWQSNKYEGQDEDFEVGPSGTSHEEKVQTKEP